MASLQTALAEMPAYSPPPIDGDFYRIANVLDERGRALIKRVRAFTEGVVAPIIEDIGAAMNFPSRSSRKWLRSALGSISDAGRLERTGERQYTRAARIS